MSRRRTTGPAPSGEPDAGLLRALLEHIDAVTFVSRAEGLQSEIVYLSPQFAELLGLSAQEMNDPGNSRLSHIHPEDRDRLERAVQDAQTAGAIELEYRLVRRDGSPVWVRTTARLMSATTERPPMWAGLTLDISATKEAELAYRESEAKYRALVEQVPAIVYIDSNDPEPDTLYVSPEVTRFLGYTPEEWMADPSLWPRSLHPEDRDPVMRAWAHAVETGEDFHLEYRYFHRSGGEIWVRDGSTLVKDAAGSPLYWMGVIQDVTDRKHAEAALRGSERRHRQLIEDIPLIVFDMADDAVLTPLFVSRQSISVLGYTPEEWIEAGPEFALSTVHPDDREAVMRGWGGAIQRREPYEVEYRAVRKDGEVRWMRASVRLSTDASGRSVWRGVTQDITARRTAEEALRTSESRYRALVEQVPAVVYEMGPDDERRTIYVSPHVEQVLRYSRQEWLDQPDIWAELLHPEDREKELAAHDLHNATREPWDRTYRLISADGQTVWVRDRAVLVGGVGAPGDTGPTWHGVMLDITAQKAAEHDLQLANDLLEFRVLERTTELADANEMMALEIGERRRMEAELRTAEERYRELVERTPGVVYVCDVTDRSQRDGYVGPQIEPMFGYSPGEWLAGVWDERLHPHDAERVREDWARSRRTGEPFEAECRYLASDGRVVWVLDRAALLTRGDDGAPKLFQGIMLDVTPRKEAEAKAAEAEERFRAVAEQGPAITYIRERQGGDSGAIYSYLSPQITEALGYPGSDWTEDELFWLSVVHPDDRDRVMREQLRAELAGEAWSLEYRVLDSAGKVHWFRDEGKLLQRDEGGKPLRYHGIYLDITERVEMERQLRAAEAESRALLEQMPAVPWTEVIDVVSGRARIAYLGPQSREILGWEAEALAAEANYMRRFVHPDDRERVLAAIGPATKTGVWDETYLIVGLDERVRTVRSIGRLVSEQDAPTQLWQGITVLISAEPEPEPAGPEPGVAREISREA